MADWQREHKRDVLVGLSCTKDVQDAVLDDSRLRDVVDIIDLKYWWYMADGELFAPVGDAKLAPRQQLREWKGKKSRSDEQVARQIRETRLRYPDKAVLCSQPAVNPWAVVATVDVRVEERRAAEDVRHRSLRRVVRRSLARWLGESKTNRSRASGELFREVGPSSAKPVRIRLVPYFAWGNRGPSEMSVWLPLGR